MKVRSITLSCLIFSLVSGFMYSSWLCRNEMFDDCLRKLVFLKGYIRINMHTYISGKLELFVFIAVDQAAQLTCRM